jgi:tetratricopeptide (TPR) repeat protein
MPSPWLESMDVPARPQPPDLRAFFGVPPDPEEKLDANIARKRRYWSGKVRSQASANAAGKRKVEEATRIIDELEKILKRGVVDPDFDLERLRQEFAAEPETRVDELADLWRILEELIAGGRLDEALRVANDARTRFRGAPIADAAFGWLAMLSSRGGGATDVLRREGVKALTAAIAAGEANADTFTWKAILELDLARPEAALDTFAEAERELDSGLTPWMHSYCCQAHAALGRPEEALAEAKLAVDDETDDLALRSNTVTALILAARVELLPIASDGDLRRYQDLIAWAAWFAVGVPEAEDRVRPYRLWSVEAESLAYTGRFDLRTIFAVATGFLALPLLNSWKTKPHWQVLRDGPTVKNAEIFNIVALGGIPLEVHGDLLARLPWWESFVKQVAA